MPPFVQMWHLSFLSSCYSTRVFFEETDGIDDNKPFPGLQLTRFHPVHLVIHVMLPCSPETTRYITSSVVTKKAAWAYTALLLVHGVWFLVSHIILMLRQKNIQQKAANRIYCHKFWFGVFGARSMERKIFGSVIVRRVLHGMNSVVCSSPHSCVQPWVSLHVNARNVH